MSIRAVTLATALGALASGAVADVVTFQFQLTGCQEVPPVLTTGLGKATVTLDTDTGDVSVEGAFQELIGEVTASHIHGLAGEGQNGGVIIPLVVNGENDGEISGGGVLTDDEIQGMLDGLTYVNVHSTHEPGGEIRGQIVHACPGDFNGDGAKNILDFVDFQSAFVAQDCEADANHDLSFDILDFVAFQGVFSEPCD